MKTIYSALVALRHMYRRQLMMRMKFSTETGNVQETVGNHWFKNLISRNKEMGAILGIAAIMSYLSNQTITGFKTDITSFKVEMSSSIQSLRQELKSDAHAAEARLNAIIKADMSTLRADIKADAIAAEARLKSDAHAAEASIKSDIAASEARTKKFIEECFASLKK